MKKWKWETIAVVAVLCIGLGIWWYISTNTIRQYEARNCEMKLISERQRLELELYNQGVQLIKINQQNRQAQQQMQQQGIPDKE